MDCTFSPTRWEFHLRFTLIIRIQRVSSTTVRCGSSHHFRRRGCQTVVLFQFVRLDAMVHVYGASYQSLNPLGVPAAPGGLSSRATEPMVSALRVSIPDACTLACAGDCKLPTPLRKTPWRRAPVLLRVWITCSLRNHRHTCGDTAHEAKAGCHRHGCAVATVPLQRRGAARNADLPEGLEAVCCARPFVCEHQLRSHPCADMPGSRGKAHKSRQTACGGRKRPWQCSPSAPRWPHHSLTFVMPCAPV